MASSTTPRVVDRSLQRGLLEACDDKRLINAGLWPRQREVLGLIESNPWAVLCIGRRSGKSRMAAITGLWNCTCRPDLDAYVEPGEVRYAVVIATSKDQAGVVIRQARALVESSPYLRECCISDRDGELHFKSPVTGALTVFRVLPCNSRGIRGYPVSCVILDEFAFFLDNTDGPAVAKAVLDAIEPSTLQFQGKASFIVCSTPLGDDNEFARLYRQAESGELPGAVAYHATTAEMNPTIDPEFLAQRESRDPISYASEYLADFVGSGDSFIDMTRVVPTDVYPVPPEEGEGWVCGLDPAFSKDGFGVAIVGRSKASRNDLVVGPVVELHPKGDFYGPLDQIAELCLPYTKSAVTDQFASKPVIAALGQRGIYVKEHVMSPRSKTDVFNELRSQIYAATLPIPVGHEELRKQLGRLQTKHQAGAAAVHNPRRGSSHGDQAQAVAMAVWELRRSGVRVEIWNDHAGRGGYGDRTLRRGDLTLVGDHHFDLDDRGNRVPPPGHVEGPRLPYSPPGRRNYY